MLKDEFYVGWQSHAPTRIGKWIRGVSIAFVVLAIGFSAVLALSQQSSGVSVFEWGVTKRFEGTLYRQPYPHLSVLRPSPGGGAPAQSNYLLVNQNKFGLDPELAERFDGKAVQLQGSLIYRQNQTMIELAAAGITLMDAVAPMPSAPSWISFGRQTLVGEIVDSKCYFGVMNPGSLLPHRACAIRCISGGIPPVLLVRQKSGPALYFLLVSELGAAVNEQVLDLVAEPVEITGEVQRQGEMLLLRADPARYRRLVP